MTRLKNAGPVETTPASAEAVAYRKSIQTLVGGCIDRIRGFELQDDAQPLTQWRPNDV